MKTLSKIAKVALLTILIFNSGRGLVPVNGDVYASPVVSYRINGGGPDYVDSNGDLFVADQAYVAGSYGYVGGSFINFTKPVAGTTDDPLYQDMHLQNGGDFSYVFDNIPSGDYDITVFLMSPVKNVKKGSVMDIVVEGVVELDDFDVIAAAGGTYIAHTETITSTVADGQLNVDFVLVSGPVSHVSAIAVVSAAPPPAEPDITVSPASIDYGDVVQGMNSDQVVTISNVGTADLTVTSLGVSGGEFSLVSPPSTPFTVTPGGTPVDVTVRFSPTSVGTQNGTLDISSDDPDEGQVSVPLIGNGIAAPEPDIAVSPVSIDFGDVVQGTNSDQVVTISNVGTADLTVTSLGAAGGEFSLLSPPATPFTITPGGTPVAVTVRFSPTTVGVQNGSLDISSDDPDEGLVSVSLTGNGIATPEPDIDVSPSSINYGNVVQGSSSDQVVTISNVGTADLTVTSLGVAGGEFSLLSPPAMPFTVTPGGTPVAVTVRFSPTTVGVQNGTLEISSDDPDESLVSVSLTGNGVTAPPFVAYRINGGGPDYVDSNGDLFMSDRAFVVDLFGYVGGTSISFTNPVAGTTDDPLYQDMRLQNGGDFSYVFDRVPSGDYDITIYLMAPVRNGSVMDIVVEGVVELDDLDVKAAAGGINIAHTETITSTVTDGQLNVDFVLVSGPVSHVSAIAVVSKAPPPAEPDITVSPASIDYGDVVQGMNSDQVVTISNVGTADLTVTSLGVSGGEFSLVSPPSTPFTVTPGGTPVDVTVRFSPTSVGTQNGTLDISSDDPDEGQVSVPLTGNGIAAPEPDIAVSPVSIDFGDVVQGTNSDQVVTISNVGTADLTVTSLGAAGGEFSLLSPPATPFTITPGGTPVAVTVRFSPTSVGVQNGSLDINSDDPDEGLVSVSLTGNGVTTPPLVAYRINGGGPNYVDSNGDLFIADQAYVANSYGYVGGSFINFTNPVAGTIDDPLYQDIHLQNGGDFSYVFDNIPSGDYDITIYLMAPVQNGSVMDIVVEGVVELDNLDVKAAAGGINIAHTETITSTVTDGQLNVDFVLVTGPVSHVSAIAVVSTAPPPETNPPTISITSPADNSTVEGTIAIDVTATDDTEMKFVELYHNTQLVGRDASQPYQLIWSTALGANGQYNLTVSASDIYGNTSTSPITLNVNNPPAAQYDIVFILSDDYRFDSMQYMPLTNALIGSESVKFDNAFVPTPLCCPSRASILSGLYSHNNGVLENGPPSGGLQSFSDTSTIATWLSQGGYRTGLYGKYLNGYDMLSTFFIPPGWDDWHAMASFPGTIDYNYDLYENGTLVHYGNQPQDYGTDVLASKAVQFIETTPAGQPLFVYFSPQPYIPAPGDVGTFSSLPPHRPPSYNESDVSDKPYWVQQLPLITDSTSSDQYHQQSLEALQGVDRAVESIIDALNRTGRLNNTVIIYTSDNGMSWGEHRWLDKKWGLYDESVKVPLWIKVPGVPGRTEAQPVVNVDFAASFAEWAGVLPQSKVDGYSLVSLLNNPAAPWPEERLLEYLGISGAFGVPERRFRAVHTGDYVYAEYDNGDREFYDLQADPYQLNNSVSDPNYSSVIDVLKKVLAAIKGL